MIKNEAPHSELFMLTGETWAINFASKKNIDSRPKLLQQPQAQGEPRQSRLHPIRQAQSDESVDEIMPLKRQLTGQAGA
jgi:hypothetical protein